jgi:hypothetical protein
VPDRYGHWQSVYGLFRRWQRDGIWARIWITLLGFADAVGLITWQVSVDSTINRAHQHAAGARRHPDRQVEPPGAEPADHGLGRSRGGFTTKIHLAAEQGRGPLRVVDHRRPTRRQSTVRHGARPDSGASARSRTPS